MKSRGGKASSRRSIFHEGGEATFCHAAVVTYSTYAFFYYYVFYLDSNMYFQYLNAFSAVCVCLMMVRVKINVRYVTSVGGYVMHVTQVNMLRTLN